MTQTQDAPSPQSRATSGSDAADAPVTVHITGFEPFDGAASNASWDAVRFLPDTIGLVDGRADLTRELLPVTFAGAMAASGDAVERLRPDVVVHVGLRSGAGAVMLETTARNEAARRSCSPHGRRRRWSGDSVRRACRWPVRTTPGCTSATPRSTRLCAPPRASPRRTGPSSASCTCRPGRPCPHPGSSRCFARSSSSSPIWFVDVALRERDWAGSACPAAIGCCAWG